jgi:hypothetical protein
MREKHIDVQNMDDMLIKVKARFTWEQQFYIYKYLVIFHKRMWYGDYYRTNPEKLTLHLTETLYNKKLMYVTIKK